MERIRAWFVTRKRWLIPVVCIILGSLFGYEGRVLIEPADSDEPIEVEVFFDE